MPIKWNCLEPLTAIGIGIGACALAPLDMGLAAAGVIGGTGLLARIKENSRKAGLEDDKLIARMQKQLIGKLDHWDSHAERAAAERADEAMKRLLPQVMLTREQLAATATKSGESAERYPVLAAREVVAELAHLDTMFAEPAAGAAPSAERLFALEAVEAALRAAKNDPTYATLLTLDITIELGRAMAETRASLAAISHKVDGVDALLRQLVAGNRAEAEARGVNAAKLVSLASRIVEQVSDPAEAEQALHRAIDELLKLREQARQGTNFGDEVDEAIRRIFAKVEADDLDGAARVQEAEFGRLAEQVEAARAAQMKMADTGLSVARLRYDAASMAHWAVEKRKLAEGVELITLHSLRVEHDDWYERAATQGSRLEMDVAIALARRSVEEALEPYDRAACQNDLGVTLDVQAERIGGEEGGALLAEAAEVYRAALTVRTREALPIDWAMTQVNLGNTLQLRGERSSGDAGLALMDDAVEAYRAALSVYTREAVPSDWAMTQNNLGISLKAQGQRSDGEAGLPLLVEAVDVFRAALTVRTREVVPNQWAMTQNNLGNALQAQAERIAGEKGIGLLAEAVEALRAALMVHSREILPTRWAATQNNLGIALKLQGARKGGEAGRSLLAESVDAFRAALTVNTREALPADWAMTQENLALSEEGMGDIAEGSQQVAHWRAAETAVRRALEVFVPGSMPYHHEKAIRSLTRIRAKLAGAG